MGVGLQDGTIHKGTRVSFIAIADDIFWEGIVTTAFLPF
jgi:hypothetical protein